MAAADTEQVRRLFVDAFGEPDTTLLHGQSWGGDVAAKTLELYGNESAYDGALLTNGVLAGGSRGYDYRLDLRVVYQYYCGNHPRPSEPQYALWRGLRAGLDDDVGGAPQRGHRSAPATSRHRRSARPSSAPTSPTSSPWCGSRSARSSRT